MSSARRSKIAAVAVFCLIALVVLGGMSWATVVTLELAKINVREQHRGLALRAVTLLDNYIGGILNAESAREQTDYVAFSTPTDIHRESDGAKLNPEEFRLPSPLLSPPHDWIDLYFHVEGGNWWSPHLPDEAAPWTVECVVSTALAQRQMRDMLDWLEAALPVHELHARVADALEYETTPDASAGGDGASVNDGGSPAPGPRVARTSMATEYQKRRDSQRASQRSYLPPGECIPSGGSEAIASDEKWEEDSDEAGADRFGSVESKPGAFVPPFWLVGPGERLKLIFVREGTARDGSMFHQGFVADWATLKPKLVDQMDHLFPDAELHPILESPEAGEMLADTTMANLPVSLEVPDIPGGAASAAWQSLRSKLIPAWLGVGAVLFVAGWGLRNLVNLTERRSQFAYTVTHELRTPLTTFRLYSDMLAAGLVPEGSKQQYLETLNRESIRLASLVESVLEYARLENHRVRLNVADTDGPTLMASLTETLEKRCEENGIEARAENGMLNGQRLRTDTDVVNRITSVLINNAVRHARSGRDPAVVLRAESDNGQLHLDVIDTGPGIDRRDVRRIFKPFRRGRGADAAAQGGVGLGLALARSWARLLGGRLDLHARHHPHYGGAHFRLTVPVQVRGNGTAGSES